MPPKRKLTDTQVRQRIENQSKVADLLMDMVSKHCTSIFNDFDEFLYDDLQDIVSLGKNYKKRPVHDCGEIIEAHSEKLKQSKDLLQTRIIINIDREWKEFMMKVSCLKDLLQTITNIDHEWKGFMKVRKLEIP